MKSCRKCGLLKPLTEFPKRRSSKDGHDAWCKVCKRAYNAIYYAKNRAAILEQKKDYWATNKEMLKPKNRARWAKNRERYGETAKRWREANREADRKSVV